MTQTARTIEGHAKEVIVDLLKDMIEDSKKTARGFKKIIILLIACIIGLIGYFQWSLKDFKDAHPLKNTTNVETIKEVKSNDR